jgi:hypothetical protein
VSETYDDGTLVCGPDGLEIHSYYFPVGTKRVAYTQVRGLRRIALTGPLSGRWRIWGTGNPRYWANLDLRRPRKQTGFVIDLGRAVSPLVTPDDPDAFESVLRLRAGLGQT